MGDAGQGGGPFGVGPADQRGDAVQRQQPHSFGLHHLVQTAVVGGHDGEAAALDALVDGVVHGQFDALLDVRARRLVGAAERGDEADPGGFVLGLGTAAAERGRKGQQHQSSLERPHETPV